MIRGREIRQSRHTTPTQIVSNPQEKYAIIIINQTSEVSQTSEVLTFLDGIPIQLQIRIVIKQ